MLAVPPAMTLRQPRAATAAPVHSGRGAFAAPAFPSAPPMPVDWPFPQSSPAPPRGWPRRPDAPAVDHDGPGVHRVERFHLLQELEHPNGGEGHPEVGPAGEVQLRHKPWGFAAVRELLPGHGGVSGGRPCPAISLGSRGHACGAGPIDSSRTPFMKEADADACCQLWTRTALRGGPSRGGLRADRNVC